MSETTRNRIIIDIFLFIAVFIVPWWVMLLIVLGLLFKYTHFYEAFFVGLIIDALYGIPLAMFYNFRFVATLTALVLFIITFYSKKLLTFTR